MKPTKKLTISALFIAIFIVTLGVTAVYSFGAIQVRVVNSLYAMSYIFPFLIIPSGIAVMLSNLLFGGMGLLDIIGGFAVAIITTFCMTIIKKRNLSKRLVVAPTLIIPALLVPIWLSPLIGVSYITLAFSIMLGQIIPAILGYVLVTIFEDLLQK